MQVSKQKADKTHKLWKKNIKFMHQTLFVKKSNVTERNCNTRTENEETKIVLHSVGNDFHGRDSIHNSEIGDDTAFETASDDGASVLIWVLGLFDQWFFGSLMLGFV